MKNRIKVFLALAGLVGAVSWTLAQTISPLAPNGFYTHKVRITAADLRSLTGESNLLLQIFPRSNSTAIPAGTAVVYAGIRVVEPFVGITGTNMTNLTITVGNTDATNRFLPVFEAGTVPVGKSDQSNLWHRYAVATNITAQFHGRATSGGANEHKLTNLLSGTVDIYLHLLRLDQR